MKQWYTADELAGAKLPGLPVKRDAVEGEALCLAWWLRRDDAGAPLVRWREGRPGDWEFHISLLPEPAAEELARRAAAEHPRVDLDLWAWFEAQPEPRRHKAQERLDALVRVGSLHTGGMSKRAAVAQVAAEIGVASSVVWAWDKRLRDVAPGDRLPALASRHYGRTVHADCDEDAWAFFKSAYLSADAPSALECYRRLESRAESEGWTFPSVRTLERRLKREISDDERRTARRRKGGSRLLV